MHLLNGNAHSISFESFAVYVFLNWMDSRFVLNFFILFRVVLWIRSVLPHLKRTYELRSLIRRNYHILNEHKIVRAMILHRFMEFNSNNVYKYTKSGATYNVTIEVKQFIKKAKKGAGTTQELRRWEENFKKKTSWFWAWAINAGIFFHRFLKRACAPKTIWLITYFACAIL